MIEENMAEQQTIVDWFDSVYCRKGARYLRPWQAYLVFLELLQVRPEHELLDVACGAGVLLKAASRYTKQLYGIDISSAAVEQARACCVAKEICLGNAESLPYRDESFDMITCLGSLERMLDASKALKEMKRVGKRDARYCFLVRNSNTFSWKYLAAINAKQRAQGHAGADTLENWRELFESHGFRIDNVLPDQYPLHRKRKWMSLLTKPVDYAEPLVSRRPIDRANEFVFVLGKQA